MFGKSGRITSEKLLNNSELCTCLYDGCHGYTCNKHGTTNIAALKQAISLYIHLLQCLCPIQGLSGHVDLVFAKTTILHSIAVL